MCGYSKPMDPGTIMNPTTRKRVEELLGYLDFTRDIPGPRCKVFFLDTDFDRPADGASFHGGLPVLPAAIEWPRHPLDPDLEDDVELDRRDDRMAHLLTLDVSDLETPGVPSHAASLSLFTPSLSIPADPLIVGVFSTDQVELSASEPMRENRYSEPCGVHRLPAIDVPMVVFVINSLDYASYAELHQEDEGSRSDETLAAYYQLMGERRLSEDEFTALEESRKLIASLPYVGGRHLKIQQEWATADGELEAENGLIMQFGDEIAGINCGDQGVVYVSSNGDDVFGDWESH